MIKALLVAMDASAYGWSAARHALELARSHDARLTGLYVLDIRYLEMPPYVDYSFALEAMPPILAAPEILKGFQTKSDRLLGDLRRMGQDAGLTVETRAEEGVPSQVIAELGRSHDLVLMGKRGEHARWGRDLLGSTAEQVARRAATPVLLAEADHRALSKALLLFDGSPAAHRAVKLAAELAHERRLELAVLTVDDDLARAASVQKEAASYLDALGLTAEYAVLTGRATKAAAAHLVTFPADLVVLGMRGHSALHDLILGSTAEQLMRTLPVPVLLVP